MLDRVFVATVAPQGWQLGRWVHTRSGQWEERQADGTVAQYSDCGPSRTAGSETVTLRSLQTDIVKEVLLLERSIQIFEGGSYAGEYLGAWEGTPNGAPTRSVLGQMSTGKMPNSVIVPNMRPVKKPNCDKRPEMVEKLYQAAKAGDEFSVHRLLDTPIDPDGVSPSENSTPLIAAATNGSVRVVELLIAAGADANKAINGQTAMMVAHQKGKKDVLRVLFGAAFKTLESIVGGGAQTGSVVPASRVSPDEDFEDGQHWRELRDVTSKLATLNNKESLGFQYQDMEELSFELPLPESSDRLREDVVRQTMKVLLNGSNQGR